MSKTAPKTNFALADANPGEWKDRSDKWTWEIKKSQRKRPAKRRNKIPLILTGYGVSLRIERNTLVVKNGLTHYPQNRK